MRAISRWTATALVLTAAAFGLGGCRGTPPRADGYRVAPAIDLFNGTDLTGWTQRGGNATYIVEDGCIVGRTAPNQPNSFLCTNQTYADFVLQLEFMVDNELNSGVQIRSNSTPEHQNGRVHGYQVEIDPSDRAWTGGIYDEGRRGWIADLSTNAEARAAFKPGEWNSMRVEAVGDRIRTWINDCPCADLRDDATRSGFIALQVHGIGPRSDPLEVRWRSIRIAPLTPETDRDRLTSPRSDG